VLVRCGVWAIAGWDPGSGNRAAVVPLRGARECVADHWARTTTMLAGELPLCRARTVPPGRWIESPAVSVTVRPAALTVRAPDRTR
jgi:hypothetical protein